MSQSSFCSLCQSVLLPEGGWYEVHAGTELTVCHYLAAYPSRHLPGNTHVVSTQGRLVTEVSLGHVGGNGLTWLQPSDLMWALMEACLSGTRMMAPYATQGHQMAARKAAVGRVQTIKPPSNIPYPLSHW